MKCTMMSTLKASVVSNKRLLPYHVTGTADFLKFTPSNFCCKFACPPCRLRANQPVHVVQILATQKRNLRPGTLVFAIPNENDEAENSSTYICADDQIPALLGNHESSNDMGVEDVASLLLAEANSSSSSVGNQGGLLDKLKAVHLHVLASEQWNASRLKLCHRNYSVSATNLIHYLALKCLDMEQLKEDLSMIGLMNLDTINPHVLSSLTAGIQLLENMYPNSLHDGGNMSASYSVEESSGKQKNWDFKMHSMRKKVLSNVELLFGPFQDARTTHIMVTVGQETTERETLVYDLLKAGATIFRINCAHGNQSVWSEIIRRIKKSSQLLERPCRILMDLAGPKLRTDRLESGPCVMKVSPKKDANGNVSFPAQVWLHHEGSCLVPPHLSVDAVLGIDSQKFLKNLEVGDTVSFSDARGKERHLKISKKLHVFSGTGFVAECSKTAYIESGTKFYIKRHKGKLHSGRVVDVPASDSFVRLKTGDLLVITRDRDSSIVLDQISGHAVGVQRVTCSSSYLFDSVKPGDPIAFDDGKIWGVIKGSCSDEIIVTITHAGLRGSKLGSEKSINIPNSEIQFEGLTSKDILDLKFVATNADMVGVSFVRDTCDIVFLRQELEKRRLNNIGIILKIETKSGFEKLPLMLLEAMKSSNPLGVMIARGDLAVECGWERLADIQEEILATCDAAHVPVIWATQVLESLVKLGVPTRAEITDVAYGRRASCIMLNKGKHVVEAVTTLDTILHSNAAAKMKAELKPLLLSSHAL